MKLKRKCKMCEKEFTAIKHTQFFCCRKCFKRDYYIRTKEKLEKERSKYPQFKCPLCEEKSSLMFDPIREEVAFDNHICPFCGIPREVTIEQENNTNFYVGNSFTIQFVISSAIVSGAFSASFFTSGH